MSNNESGNMVFGAPARSGSIEITVNRADGTVEELGIVSYYHKNPLVQAQWEIEKFGEIKPETWERLGESAKKKIPYVVGIVSVGLVGLAIKRLK